MRKSWVVGVMAAWLAIGSAAVRAADMPALPLKLTISPATYEGRPALAMTLRVTGDEDGKTKITLPSEWANEKELWRVLKDFAVEGAQVTAPSDEPQTRIARHAPSAPLTLTWKVVQDYTGEPNFSDLKSLFRPTVNAQYAVMLMQTVLPSIELGARNLGIDPRPRTTPPPVCDVVLSFEGFAPGWTLATALGNGATQTARQVRCDALWDSNLALGDFRLVERQDEYGIVRLAVRGTWALSDQVLLAKFAVGRAAAAAEFKDSGPEQILVSLAATAPLGKNQAVFGTAFGGGFFGFATPNASLASLKVWWNHEQVHYWIPNRLGQAGEGSETARAWFNEGFTDYFSMLNAYRTREVDTRGLATEWNTRVLKPYLASRVREAANATIAEGFWDQSDLRELPYQRGALLALNWNAQIKSASHGRRSLADVIATLLGEAKKDPNVLLTPARIVAAAKAAGVENAAEDVAMYIDAGHLIVPRADALGPCGKFEIAKGAFDITGEGWTSKACAAWLE